MPHPQLTHTQIVRKMVHRYQVALPIYICVHIKKEKSRTSVRSWPEFSISYQVMMDARTTFLNDCNKEF